MRGLVVPAAGRGQRFGSPENKLWAEMGGRSVLEWTLRAVCTHPAIDAVVLVGRAAELDRLRAAAAPYGRVHAVVEGGATRSASVWAGLEALPAACDVALVHDAARPAVSAGLIQRVVEATERYGAAAPALPVSDTVKEAGPDGRVLRTVSRDGLWTVQTPQGARRADLLAAYARLGADASATDEAGLLEAAGFPVYLVEGDEANVKVTRAEDLDRAARALLPPAVPSRTGMGYDVHRFAEGRPLWLGGVPIPHARGLAGHSDADVMLHAVCDALLGAACLGDIGRLFPDTDPAHKDRPSVEFVREVRRRLEAEGWQAEHVDVTLLAEEPRIGPFREQMAAAIADGLALAPTQVNVKATTAEGMGFVGRREGIACWATATIALRAP